MPNALVLDASAAVDLVLRRPERGDWLVGRVRDAGTIHAPHVIDVEVASALRRAALSGALGSTRAKRALDLFLELRMRRYAARLLLERAWALRDSLSAYDAMYVALAELLDVPLVTTDARLARTGGHRATVLGFPG